LFRLSKYKNTPANRTLNIKLDILSITVPVGANLLNNRPYLTQLKPP